MFQNLWTGNGAFLIDMAHHKHRDAICFRQPHQRHGAVLDLGNTARRGSTVGVIQRLDGIGNENIRLYLADGAENFSHTGFRQNQQLFTVHVQPLRPHFQLPLTFFAGDIQYSMFLANMTADLQQQCGFADTRCTAHQNQRTLDGSAAQNPVQLGRTGGKPNLVGPLHFCQGPGFPNGSPDRRSRFGQRRFLLLVFLNGIPRAAGWTPPLPLHSLIAAAGTKINGLRLHVRSAPLQPSR